MFLILEMYMIHLFMLSFMWLNVDHCRIQLTIPALMMQQINKSSFRGQVMNLKHLSCIVDVDLCYDNLKYRLQAAQTSPNSYHLAMNNTTLEVR